MKQRAIPEEYKPLSEEERRSRLLMIRDKLLTQIESGKISSSERINLIKSYDAIDRIIERRGDPEEDTLQKVRELLSEIPSAIG